jgi:hypothetical protein
VLGQVGVADQRAERFHHAVDQPLAAPVAMPRTRRRC